MLVSSVVPQSRTTPRLSDTAKGKVLQMLGQLLTTFPQHVGAAQQQQGGMQQHAGGFTVAWLLQGG